VRVLVAAIVTVLGVVPAACGGDNGDGRSSRGSLQRALEFVPDGGMLDYLDWEAGVSYPREGLGVVLAFDPEYPFSWLTATLEREGFARSTYRGVPIYSLGWSPS
jgi:hypothetical protein